MCLKRDRYQNVHQRPANEMIIEDAGLGFERSQDVVVISITSRPRTEEQKKAFYKLLVKELGEGCGIDSNDIMVSIVINEDTDWSFGLGEAQFLTAKLEIIFNIQTRVVKIVKEADQARLIINKKACRLGAGAFLQGSSHVYGLLFF